MLARQEIFLTRIGNNSDRPDEVYRDTDPVVIRRLFWSRYSEGDKDPIASLRIPPPAMQHLTVAAASLHQALAVEPLNDAATTKLVLLDFLAADTADTRWNLQRLIDLRPKSHRIMRTVGDLAIDCQQWDLAASAWRLCTRARHDDVVPILRRVHEIPALTADQVIADDTMALATAAKFELQSPDPNRALLQRAIPALRALLRMPPDHPHAAMGWADVLIRNYVSLGNDREATRLAGRIARRNDPEPWLLLSGLLRAKGDMAGARSAAEQALAAAPNDERASKLVASLLPVEAAARVDGGVK